MAVNAVYTFPRRVEIAEREGFPKGFSGGTIPIARNTFVAPLDNNPIHKDGMEWAKQYVQSRARINSSNMRNYNMGGSRNYLPKPQPQGSFFRIQGNSGSNHYGFGFGEVLTGQGGSFRTKPGAEYGRRQLRKRGEQLEQMAMEVETGLPVGLPGTQVPVPTDEQETKRVALDLAISSLVENFVAGDDTEIKLDEVSKIFNTLRTDGFKLPYDDLNEYYKDFYNIVSSLRDAEAVEEDNIKIAKSKQVAIYRIFLLLATLMVSFNLDEKSRKSYVSSQVRKITKVRSLTEEPLTALSPSVLEVSRGTLPQRLAEEGGDDDDEPPPPPPPGMPPMGEQESKEEEPEGEEEEEEEEGAEAPAVLRPSAEASASTSETPLKQLISSDTNIRQTAVYNADSRLYDYIENKLRREGKTEIDLKTIADELDRIYPTYYEEELAKLGYFQFTTPKMKRSRDDAGIFRARGTLTKWRATRYRSN